MTFSGKISFPSKVPEFLHVPFNLVEKHSPVSFLGLNALVQLCCVHCARFYILSSFFSETKCKPAIKIQGECFTMYYFIKKHMQKFRYFRRKINFTRKSHLHPSCTKPFLIILHKLNWCKIGFHRATQLLHV